MREIKLTLGGEEFTLRELSARKNSIWRKQLDEPFGELIKLLQSDDTEINKASDLVGVMARHGATLVAQIETIPDIVISYSPTLEAKREWLDDNATETEYLSAFMILAGVAYPTDFFTQQAVAMRKLGSLRPLMMTSSPLANGGSGQTN